MSSTFKRKLKRSTAAPKSVKSAAVQAAADAIVNEMVVEAKAKSTTTKSAADFVQPITTEYDALEQAKAALKAAIVNGECIILERAIALGKLLASAKAALMVENLRLGVSVKWKRWVQDNLPEGLGSTTANIYIRLAENEATIKDAPSLRKAIKLLPPQRTTTKGKGKDAGADADDNDANDDDDNSADGDDDANGNDDDNERAVVRLSDAERFVMNIAPETLCERLVVLWDDAKLSLLFGLLKEHFKKSSKERGQLNEAFKAAVINKRVVGATVAQQQH
jgi:hypothetical protein